MDLLRDQIGNDELLRVFLEPVHNIGELPDGGAILSGEIEISVFV